MYHDITSISKVTHDKNMMIYDFRVITINELDKHPINHQR